MEQNSAGSMAFTSLMERSLWMTFSVFALYIEDHVGLNEEGFAAAGNGKAFLGRNLQEDVPDKLIGRHLQLRSVLFQGEGAKNLISTVQKHQLGFGPDELIEKGIADGNIPVVSAGFAHFYLADHSLAAGGKRLDVELFLVNLAGLFPDDALQTGPDDVASDKDTASGAQPDAFGAQAVKIGLHIPLIIAPGDDPAQLRSVFQLCAHLRRPLCLWSFFDILS